MSDPDKALLVAAEAFRLREAEQSRTIADLREMLAFYRERLASTELLCAAQARELSRKKEEIRKNLSPGY